MNKSITLNRCRLLLGILLLVLTQFASYGQGVRDITGTVKDQTGEGLPGASVKVKGQAGGTSTSPDGTFKIKAATGSVLTISYVGFIPQEIKIGDAAVYSVILQSNNDLDEIVVTGYGTQRKRDLTGSTSSVSAEKIREFPIISADQALQGRAAGVQVTQTSGAPGGAVQVRIRGVNSTGGNGANQPLYVIDGLPLYYSERENSLGTGNTGNGDAASNAASPLSTISPNDIESIEILKDASAAAIYGSRAANGVVLITTKQGKSGKSVIQLSSNYAIQSLREKIPVTNAQERVALLMEHRRNAGSRGGDATDVFGVNPYTFGAGTDWQDQLFRTAPMQNHNLSFSGGSDKITYLTSGDYFSQDGIVISTYAKRASGRINLDFKPFEKLKLGIRSTFNYEWERGQQM